MPNKGKEHPGALKIPSDIPISLKQDREAVMDVITLLKEKFPEVNDEDFAVLKRVMGRVFISEKGKVIYYQIRILGEHADIFLRYEKQLHEVMEALST